MKQTDTKETTKTRIKTPQMYKVIILNDEETTFDFVTFVLEEIFLKGIDEAQEIALKAHREGSALVGIYTHDIAFSRLESVEMLKKNVGFPLTFNILPE